MRYEKLKRKKKSSVSCTWGIDWSLSIRLVVLHRRWVIRLVDSNDEWDFSLLTRTLTYVVLQRRVRYLLRPDPDRFSHAFLRAAVIQNRTKQGTDLWSSYTGESQKRKLICESRYTGVFIKYFLLAQESREILQLPLIIRA